LLELKEGHILEMYNLQRHLDQERKRVEANVEKEAKSNAKIKLLQKEF
jgi:hypothetical protein